MSRKAILITGAAGEVGLSLIEHFSNEDEFQIVAVDLKELHDVPAGAKDIVSLEGDITNKAFVQHVFATYDVRKVFHLAGVLSSGGEKNPARAHEVNVNGSFHLLQAAQDASQRLDEPVLFIFPSSIAVYGIPSLDKKRHAGAIREDQYLAPVTMYGNNKLYVENIGRYFAQHYGLLEQRASDVRLDFRALRFPGLLSSETLPVGGTTDYASQMIHACAQRRPYASFASAKVKIPFMTMPDGVLALRMLARAPREHLTQTSYNVTAFSVTVEQLHQQLLMDFPGASITYRPDAQREYILNTWPEDTDDTRARADWGWKPANSFASAFQDYLIPGILRKYR